MSVVAEPEARGLVELEGDRALVEAVIGRPLRPAERAIDVRRLNAAMNEAKDELEAIIEREKRRAIQARLREERVIDLALRPVMYAPLERLYQLGRREARAELERLGYLPARALAAARQPRSRLARLGGKLELGLNYLSRRVGAEFVEADVAGLSRSAMVSALYSVPGARNIASQLVSGAVAAGLGQTFEENEELVGGWEYTAVMDSGTCDICDALDGTAYASWAEIQEVLPDGGPNPECLGGDRCRCRPVPAAQG